MKQIFIQAIYETVVKESLQSNKGIFETAKISSDTIHYWKQAIGFYNGLSHENKEIFMRIIEQTMIDTVSHMLGVIDGSSTLNDCSLEPKLLLDNIDTEGELQDMFLEFIEERDSNS